MTVNLPPTKTQVKAALRAGRSREEARALWREEARKAQEDKPTLARRANSVMRDGVAMDVLDPAQTQALKEIARLSLLFLEYTERGGAPAAMPYQFVAMVENLRLLEPLLRAEPGTGELVGGLLQLLDSLEAD